jgi:hypothetical protein
MQKLLLFITFVALQLSLKSQVIPNSDFEDWSLNSVNRLTPDLWQTNNTLYTNPPISQTTGYLGGFAPKLNIVPTGGIPESGTLNYNQMPWTALGTPTAITGYWKLNNVSGACQVVVKITFFDASFNQIGVGKAESVLFANIPNYVAFSAPINFTSSAPIAKYNLACYVSYSSPDFADYAVVDKINISGVTVGLNDPNFLPNVSKIVNSGNSKSIQIKINSFSKVQAKLYDITGKMVSFPVNEDLPQGQYEFPLNTHEMVAGIYLCQIIYGNKSETIKLIIE